MEIRLNDRAQKDLDYWEKTGNQVVLKKISQLLSAITNNPFEGIGKPEALKHDLAGK